jgi:hypothetical protein
MKRTTLWTGLFLACMICYSTITVVAIRGAFDIKSMLENLRDRDAEK